MQQKIAHFLSGTRENPTLKRISFIISIHAILPAIFIIIYLNLGQREVAKKTFESNLIQIAHFTANSYEEEFLKTKHILSVMASLPEIKAKNKKQCEAIAKSILNTDENKFYTRVGATDKSGNVYCNTLSVVSPLNISDDDYFQKVRETKSFVVGGYSVGQVTGNRQIATAYPVLDEKGNFDGMVSAVIDTKWLGKLAENVKLPEGYTFTAMDQNGIIIARHPDSEKWIGENIKDKELGSFILSANKEDGAFQSTGLDEIERLYAYTVIRERIGADTIYAAIGVPQTELDKAANERLLKDIIILLVVIFTTFFILAFDLHFIFRKIKNVEESPQAKNSS